MYHSTNRAITNGAQDLAFEAGFSLVDSTVNMLHPFGKYNKATGLPRTGCFETDRLAGAEVFLDGLGEKIFDAETTQMLANHEAHYHFPEIAERFRKFGSVVMLLMPNGKEEFAGVSHHYSHMGIETSDGISVKGANNMFAIGDASGIGFWTNHKERFPGTALVKCLVDARLLSDNIGRINCSNKLSVKSNDKTSHSPSAHEQIQLEKEIKERNSKYLTEYIGSLLVDRTKSFEIARFWEQSLLGVDENPQNSILRNISLSTARAHQANAAGQNEPIKLQYWQLSDTLKVAI